MTRHLSAWPAEFVTGPRAVGKTTTALRYARAALRLDRESEQGLTRDDPDAAISEGPYPLLIDEWQHVPGVLGAVKRSVDASLSPKGRFIITGSARNDLHLGQWPLTGRVLETRLWPLTGRERFGDASAPSLFDRWDGENRFALPADPPDVLGYVDIALEGGFPGAIGAAGTGSRDEWMRSYVNIAVTRDLGELDAPLGRRRSPELLRRCLTAYAMNTAGTTSDSSLAQLVNVDARSARAYLETMSVLRLIDDTPAWHSRRLKRLTSMPKRYVTDSGLAAWVMGVDREALKRDSRALGQVIETFVAAQIRTEADASRTRVHLSHLRDHGGQHEIDLIAEFGRRLAAFEVKSTSAPTTSDARHIAWLRDRLPPEEFAGGVVFHTGPHRFQLSDGVEAVPICGLWG